MGLKVTATGLEESAILGCATAGVDVGAKEIFGTEAAGLVKEVLKVPVGALAVLAPRDVSAVAALAVLAARLAFVSPLLAPGIVPSDSPVPNPNPVVPVLEKDDPVPNAGALLLERLVAEDVLVLAEALVPNNEPVPVAVPNAEIPNEELVPNKEPVPNDAPVPDPNEEPTPAEV